MIDYNTFEWPRITAETPLSEVKRIHQLIWDYVVEYGEKPETPYEDNCILCSFVFEHRDPSKMLCSPCPAKWPSGSLCSIGSTPLYRNWLKTKDPELAKKIRDIPFKGDTPETIKDIFEKYPWNEIYTPTEWDTGPDIGKEIVE